VMNSPDETIFRMGPLPSGEGGRRPGEGKPFVVMYHGSLVERNGLGLAIDAIGRVRQSIPCAQLRIYGSRNTFLDSVIESVRVRGLEDAVYYMGPKPLEQIVEAIEACDVGIIPNQRSIFTELNTPTRIFEYLALGKPVIAPKAAGITDYFDEQSLVFFELGNAEDLAHRIEYVFHNPAAVTEITRRARQIHLAHTWRAEKSRLTGLVEGLLRDRGEPVSAASVSERNLQGR
jgi:glycosyltransferase involved in cell wall biosynthesis